ncbi:RNA polymerase sigma factor [Chitinophaga nivalis]|uniref:Sigma-70 family RNA polymerase sigma factor n=1 Tax=Chitinophaga nivalis TaxID=2991709 RepID=A0ABT3ILX4_9BACT|nr:sigma-70 family RNA polymerase sigma factor [Chitinophaga nivalis]MCW3465350.1 sigma-70 family RNA polymerase sigma factor [Chitinophaga nivalis]MCW3484958.1 sigma-70 family RNA polymerase sigma factor [Chitinophaga nivalis]
MKDPRSLPLQSLYDTCFPTVTAFILRNGGSREDAEDVFQDAISVFSQKLATPDFQLTASPHTYLYAIARNSWLKQLRQRRHELPETELVTLPVAVEIKQEMPPEEQVSGWLQRITRHCRRLLKALFFYQVPMQKLMQQMGWKNRHTADNQKYKCLQQLKKVSTEKGA